MRTIVNKTFDEIALGDTASVQRTLQAGDVRAWAAAFGDADMLAGTGESQAAAGIVTAMLTALVGSALPGPGSSIRATSVQIKGALPIGAVMTAAARGAGEAAGSGDRRAGRPMHRSGGPGRSRPRSWKLWRRRRGSNARSRSIGSKGLSSAVGGSSRC